jgi:hypothetical protein
MDHKKTISMFAAVLCLLLAITAIVFSVQSEKQKMKRYPVLQKAFISTPENPGKQIQEKRLQVAERKFHQVQQLLNKKNAVIKQNNQTLQSISSQLGWSLRKNVKQTEYRHSLLSQFGITAHTPKTQNLSSNFTIISTYPEDQATNVPLDTLLSVTFSDSLDKFSPLEVVLFPPPNTVSYRTLTDGGKTISEKVVLDSNRTYQLFAMTAVSVDSQWLKPQLAATFSTGSSMPTGSIFGKITLPVDPTSKMAVAAVFSTSMMDSEEPYRVTEITANDGSYSIENLPAGDYTLIAIQDLNGDLQFTELDPTAIHDTDADGQPDSISVSEGQAAGSIDLLLIAFKAVSSYPPDSTLNVPTDTTLSISYNLPVEYDEDSDISIFPYPISQGPISVSPDGKTLHIPVSLADNTFYQIFSTEEIKTQTEPEQRQLESYLVSFSTGSSFSTASISGTVKFTNFDPTNAFAFLIPPDGGEEDITNITKVNLLDGTYQITKIAPGTYYPTFFAKVDGQEIFVMHSDSVEVTTDTTITGINIDLTSEVDITFYGRIKGSGGSGGIAGVEIQAYNKDEDVDFEGTSNFLGFYRMMVLEGLYEINLNPPENSEYIERHISDFNITTNTRKNFILEKGNYIFGVVTDTGGAPIPQVSIGVDETATQDFVMGGITDDQGEYRVAVPSGTYDVYFYPWQSRYISTQINNVVVTADYELNQVLQSGSLVDGIITNEDSTPLEGVGVIAFQAGTFNLVTTTDTDNDGYYGFGLTPGTYDISFDPRRSYTDYLLYAVRDVTVPPDSTINVVLERGSVISGRVTDPEDNPVQNAQVEAVDTLYNRVFDNWTDESGNYSLIVPYGTYHVRVWPYSAYLAPTTIHSLTVPPEIILDIQLQYPQLRTVTGRVTGSNLTPMDSVRLDIRNEWTYERSDTTLTDVSGVYTVQLMDGRHSIIFRSGQWINQGYPNQAASPSMIYIYSDTTLDFTLAMGHILNGTVADTSDNPVGNANLSFREPDFNRGIKGASTDVNGNYSVVLSPASYRLRINPPSYSNLLRLWTDVNFTGIETYNFNLETIPFHDAGNVVLSWSAGQYGLSGNNGGQGFQYPPGQTNNHLFRSYLLIAMNNNQISEEEHFQPVSTPHYVMTTPGIVSDQDGYTAFDDRLSYYPVGITVTQNSYTYASDPHNDYVVLRLVISNNDYFAKNIVIGVYFDWDLGNSRDDVGDYDADRALGYIYSSDAPSSIHVGTAVLSTGGATSYRVYDVNNEGHLDYWNKYTTLTEGFLQTSAGPGDMRYYLATGPFTLPLAGQNNIEVAFAILAGDSLADLQANATAAQAKYNTIVAIEDDVLSAAIPSVFSLSQNYPNPFNPETRIQYGLPKTGHVRLTIYNLLGQKVRTLVDTQKAPGFYTTSWDGTNDYGNLVASGVYIYRIEAGEFVHGKKLLLLR